MRILRREDNRLRPQDAKILRSKRLRHDVLRLPGAAVITCQLAAVDDVRVEGIRNNIPVFLSRHRMPLADSDLAIIAPAGNARRAALLLSAAKPVGKGVVG